MRLKYSIPLWLDAQIHKARWRQEHGFERSPSDGEGGERGKKAANDLDRLSIRLVTTAHGLCYYGCHDWKSLGRVRLQTLFNHG